MELDETVMYDVGELSRLATQSKMACQVVLEVCQVVLELEPLAQHRPLGQVEVCIVLATGHQYIASDQIWLGVESYLDQSTGIMIGLFDVRNIIQAERDLPSGALRNDKAVSVAKEGYAWAVVRRFGPGFTSECCKALLLSDCIQSRAISITKLDRIDVT